MRIRGGVRRVHVVSYQSPEGILGEVFTNEGTGTLIVADVNALPPAEQQSQPHEAGCGTRARRSTSACCATRPARTTRSMSGWCAYDMRASHRARARCCTRRSC